MNKNENIEGFRVGRLIVKKFLGSTDNWSGLWECECDCGKTVNVYSCYLINGGRKSCGCLKVDILRDRSTKHGLSGGAGHATRLYRIWLHMRGRCFSKDKSDYKHYGGRGITVCKEWDDYKSFYMWAYANGYKDDLTIERVNNDGNYEPSNCKWATRKEQSRNTRASHFITFNGIAKTLAEWSEDLGFSGNLLLMRLRRGWSVEKALTTPVKKVERG
jgi:hypothetical protein